LKLYVQFVNTKTFGRPMDVKQVSHIGWSADGGFDIKNIPGEWKKLFKDAGISRKQLEENPELQQEVLNIMKKADETVNTPVTNTGSNIPTPPVINTNAPIPPPMMSGPKPPPLPGARITPDTPVGGGSVESHNTSSSSGGGGVGGRGGLLDQIKGGTSLKKVDPNERPPPPSGGGNLLSTLQNALMSHRKDIEGDDDDDWSNDWDEED